MEILVFYFICIEMVVTQNYGIIWMGFSEMIRAGIGKYKDGKNIQECPSNLLSNAYVLGY